MAHLLRQWIRFLKSGYLIADFGNLASTGSQWFYPLHFLLLETNLKSGICRPILKNYLKNYVKNYLNREMKKWKKKIQGGKYPQEDWKLFWLNKILTTSSSKAPCREENIKQLVKVLLPLFYKSKWTWIYGKLTLQINVF